jgi:hypothetical protein
MLQSRLDEARAAVKRDHPNLRNYLLILAKSKQQVQNGESNGDLLAVIVRDYVPVTALLRRSEQPTRLGGLPYVVVQSGRVEIL